MPPGERKETDAADGSGAQKRYDGRFAGSSVFFFAGGIVKRILNFGSDAPIDVEVNGYDLKDARQLAGTILTQLRGIEGLADVQNKREENYPELDVVVDREKAARPGFRSRRSPTRS